MPEVGATDSSRASGLVLAEKADLGIAFDGDGDRVIMVDHEGNKVDGDQIMYIIAREGLRQGQLREIWRCGHIDEQHGAGTGAETVRYSICARESG